MEAQTVKIRGYVRKRVTEIFNKSGDFSNLTSVEIHELKAKLKGYSTELGKYNQIIQNSWTEDTKEETIEKELSDCETYNDKILRCLALLETPETPPPKFHTDVKSLLTCPTAPLPKFSSKEGEDLCSFFREFEETLVKYKLPDYDKLLLLKQQLSGRASILVSSLESDKQGFSHAKELLTKAFASNDVQVANTIKELLSLKMLHTSDPYEYFSKVRTLMERVKKLDLDLDSFLQYFIWEGMNKEFRKHMTEITGKNKPDLKSILDKFYVTTERYLEYRGVCSIEPMSNVCVPAECEAYNVSSESTNMAIKTSFDPKKRSFKPCSICTKLDRSDASHPIYKCEKFPTPKSKIEKLKELSGCLKCGGLTHDEGSFRYRFNSKCVSCKRWHFNFLCESKNDQQSTGVKSKDSKPSKAITTTLATIDLAEDVLNFSSIEEKGAILPTFSFSIDGKGVRALKDSGSTNNIILESLADDLNLKPVKTNVTLCVTGVNTKHVYKTKIVEVPLSIGDSQHIVNAICIPKMEISLELDGLGLIVEEFQKSNYVMADSFLCKDSSSIEDIKFILGTKSSYCLPITNVSFRKSLFSNSPIGVLLEGDLAQMTCDLGVLPSNPNFNCHLSTTTDKIPLDILERNENFSFDSKNIDNTIEKASKALLNEIYPTMNYCEDIPEEEKVEKYSEFVDKLLSEASFDESGSMVLPLLWNEDVKHKLSKNQNLSKAILKHLKKKYFSQPEILASIDGVFKDQLSKGIIEEVTDFESFSARHPDHSFLPFMPIFRPEKESTKVRVVFLSNLSDRRGDSEAISHNQAMECGPSLNQKLSSALMNLRFDDKLMSFDIVKAFNNISLSESDQSKLMFYWFKDVQNKDFSLVPYKNNKLTFGLRCSPLLLMVALHKILLTDSESDPDDVRKLKNMIYHTAYMDNVSITSSDSEYLSWAYEQLPSIFESFPFGLQQFVVNDQNLQSKIDSKLKVETPKVVKLLGMYWDRVTDTLSTGPICLDSNANTKRTILSSIASQYDLNNINAPILNRSRLFLHKLQCDRDYVDWDLKLSSDLQREWANIVKQANSYEPAGIDRCVGPS